jgi:2-(1,2-epoxy-1,2-dihydrophenyl)acetyl-CoA isomerase
VGSVEAQVEYPAMEGVMSALDAGVLEISLCRPERRNALTPDQVDHVSGLVALAERDDEVRVVVLTGTGGDFCAGADLRSVDLSAQGGQVPPVSMGRNVFLPLLELSKPLVAKIDGVAAGGGLGFALCCDIRVASERARFATAFSRIGITANDAVGWLLPRTVGVAKALELIWLGTPIDAAEALRIGLVSYVVPAAELDARVSAMVRAFAEGPPVANALSKRLVRDGLERTYREHVLAQEYASLANRVLAPADVAEGVAAFAEKRPPRFRGFVGTRRWKNY